MKILSLSVFFFFMFTCVAFSRVAFSQVVPENAAEEKPVSMAQAADDMKFSNGLHFMELSKTDRAEEELREYLEIYFDGTHRSQAWDKLASIYFERMEYLEAIACYRGLYEEFSNTEDGASACYNIGLCYIKMGYDSSAAETFRNMIRSYPSSPYAARAQLQMDLIGLVK